MKKLAFSTYLYSNLKPLSSISTESQNAFGMDAEIKKSSILVDMLAPTKTSYRLIPINAAETEII